ncbi:hypothetical protein OK015_27915 [Mycobacterium sp. Aquia_216]|uniref:hypothetical protein n=1 Tax=Mycobacterium sp. Aquia_216 TaxID=2991729 RepID=UPI00227D4E3F|nr:hypothetical protein [Mycobacterium sp. Aquia_216]WAJ44870.1 hypothetical protein OK015_27915 [Mycobacterium sp. Aquia_216]
MNENRSQGGAIQLLGMIAGLMLAPIATPALIWATIAANLPLALVIVQLFVMAVISNWLSRKTIRPHELIEDDRDDQAMSNLWSRGAPNGYGARHGDRTTCSGIAARLDCRGCGQFGRDHGIGV